MTSTPTRHAAAEISEAALGAVFGAVAVSALREDSPLSAVGLVDADLVALSDAVSLEATRRGLTCVLGDDDLVGLATVGDLVTIVEANAAAERDVS